VTLREEHRLRVFENTVLRRMSGLRISKGNGKVQTFEKRTFYIVPLARSDKVKGRLR
jgi:hypothetical protein